MGKPDFRYVAKPVTSGNWRVWDRKLKRWWENPFGVYPEAVLSELNGAKDPARLVVLGKTNKRP